MTRITAYQHLQTTILRGGRLTKWKGIVASVAPIVGVVALFGLTGQQAQAANECGPDLLGLDAISCPAGSYPDGIIYSGSDGLELTLDDSTITVGPPVGTPGVSVTSLTGQTGNISIISTNFKEITTAGTNAAGLVTIKNDSGDIDLLVQMDGGSIITNGFQANAVQAWMDSNQMATRNVTVRMTGGNITTRGFSADGLTATNRATAGNTLVEMTGGSIMIAESAGVIPVGHTGSFAPPFGISAYVLNSASTGSLTVRMTDGEIISEAERSYGINVENQGQGITSVEVTGSGTTIQTNAADASGINVRHLSSQEAYTILVANGASVTGGYGAGTGISAASLYDGTISIGADATLSAYSDVAIKTQFDNVPDGITLAAVTVVNDGTIFGTVSFADQGDIFVNASSNSWNIRNFADTNGDLVRDREAVAVSDFGGGADIFSNTGTVRLLTVEDMSEFTPGTEDDTAPMTWDNTGQYFAPGSAGLQNPLIFGIQGSGIERAHLINLERFENAGLITMADAKTGGTAPVAGDVFVITGGAAAGTPNGGQFISNGGALHIDTVLNDGVTDITDVLVVDRAVLGTGATGITVTNAGGLGASTDINRNGVFDADEGILVVQALESGEAGAFKLASPVAAGAYEYLLDQTDDQSWYLHSVFSNSARVFEAAPYVFLDGMARMPTLEQRRGARRSNSETGTLEPTAGGWIRVHGDRSDINLNTGTSYHANTWGLQAGFDLPVEPGENGEWVLGLTAQAGNSSTNVTTMTGVGTIRAESLGIGATATWYGYNDVYVDLQAQANWARVDYSSSLHGVLASDELARSYLASIEIGRRFASGENHGLIPQAQLTWASVDGGSFTDSVGNAIDLGTNKRVTGRLGLAYDYEWHSDDGASMQNAYAIANILHDFSSNASVNVAGATLASSRAATWGEIGVGGSVTWRENTTLYGEASYREAFGSNRGRGLAATGGLRIQW